MEQKDPILKYPFSAATIDALTRGIRAMVHEVTTNEDEAHICTTPERVVKAYAELMSGVGQDPKEVLSTTFDSDYNEMISICDIDFVSLCMHHLLPFVGVVHFAYIPSQKIVGLSKIPRLVEILSRRPQIQERLTEQIAWTFEEMLHPEGCAVMIEAWHGCVGVRGVRKPNSKMRTTALTGVFLTNPAAKDEFLMMALHSNGKR